MILSNVSIQEALDKGWLVISPEPTPRRMGPDLPQCPYQTSAVDLRLGHEIAYFREGLAINIDLRRGTFAELFGAILRAEPSPLNNPIPWARKRWSLGKHWRPLSFPYTQIPWHHALQHGSRAGVRIPGVAYSFISRRRPYTPASPVP